MSVGGEVSRLYILFDANGKPYLKGLKDLQNETHKAGDSMEKAWAKFGKKATAAVAVAAAAAVAAMGAVAVASVKAAASFEYEMSRIKANAGATDAELSAMRATVLQLGKDTVFSAGQTAQAANELVKAGLSVGDAMQALPGMLALASAGELDVASAAEITANQMSVFGLAAKDASAIADTLALTANRSTTQVSLLSDSLAMSGAVAAQAGLTLQETSAALALLANNGLKGSDAGTSLKQMFMQLMGPSEKARGLMRDYGITAYDASGQMLAMDQIIENVAEGLEGLTDEERDYALSVIFGSDAVRAANIMLKEGSQAFRDMTGVLSQAGAAQDIAATKMDNLRGSWEQFKGSWETALIAMGSDSLLPLRGILDELTQQTNDFIEAWEAMAGTSAWKQGGFEVKLDLAAGTITDAVDDLLSRAAEAIEGVDWSSVGKTIGETAGALVGDAFKFAAGDLTPMLVDIAVGIVQSIISNAPDIGAGILGALVEGVGDLAWDIVEIPGRTVQAGAEAGAQFREGLIGPSTSPEQILASLAEQQAYIKGLAEAVREKGGVVDPWSITRENFLSKIEGGEVAKAKAQEAGFQTWKSSRYEGMSGQYLKEQQQIDLIQEDDLRAQYDALQQNVQAVKDLGVAEEGLAGFNELLSGTYSEMVNPANAWATALEKQGGAAKNSQQAIEDYMAELQAQATSWETFETDLKTLATKLGPEVGAEAIMAAADQGPQFVHALVGADSATAKGALDGLVASLGMNMSGLAPEILALCKPGGDAAAEGLLTGMEETLTSEATLAAMQGATETAATVDLAVKGREAAATFRGGYIGYLAEHPLPAKTGGWTGLMAGISGAISGGVPAAEHDTGGYLPPGISLSINKTGRPEPVLTPRSADQLLNIAPVIDQLAQRVASLGQNLRNLSTTPAGSGALHVHVEDSSSINRAREHGGRFARV